MLRMKAASQRGMPNGGTLCYQISLLQALFHQPKLVNFLADSHLPQDCVTDPGQSCLVCAFRIVALAYWKSIKTKDSYPTLFSGLNRLCSRCKLLPAPDLNSLKLTLLQWDGERQLEWCMGWRTLMSTLAGSLIRCLPSYQPREYF